MDEQQQNQRTNLALMLVVMMTVGVMWWTGGFGSPPQPVPDAGAPQTALVDGGTVPSQVAFAASADGGQLPVAEAQLPQKNLPQVTVPKNREDAKYLFSSEGGGLASAELEGRKMRDQAQLSWGEGFQRLMGKHVAEPPQMNVAQPVRGNDKELFGALANDGAPIVAPPLGLSVVTNNGTQILLPAFARYAVEDEGGAEGTKLTFRTRTDSLEAVKRFEWSKEGFELQMTVELKNVSSQPIAGEYAVEYSRAIDAASEEAPSFLGGVGNQSRCACLVGDDYKKVLPKDGTKVEEFKGPISFVAIDQQYFLSAIYPLEKAVEGRCVLAASASARRSAAFFPLSLMPGQSMTQSFGVYLGPKDVDLLATVPSSKPGVAANPNGFTPHLEKSVDFGIWTVICKVLLAILKTMHSLVGNWGLAIILLTVAVKIVLIPLTHKSMVAAENMKKLQPQVNALREKYKDDKEKQNAEMMKLYQEQKVNPFGGCLPMVLQMPIWFALYTTLRNSFQIYQEPFIAPLFTDLTYKDPTYLLPLLLGVTMIITQRLQPQMMDAAQAKMMTWFIPILFTFTMRNYPAGLTLYIFTNNLLSIAQQWALKRYIARSKAAPSTQGAR